MTSRMEVEQDRFLDLAWNELNAEEKQLMNDEDLYKLIERAYCDAFDHLYAAQLAAELEVLLEEHQKQAVACRSRFDERHKGEQQ